MTAVDSSAPSNAGSVSTFIASLADSAGKVLNGVNSPSAADIAKAQKKAGVASTSSLLPILAVAGVVVLVVVLFVVRGRR